MGYFKPFVSRVLHYRVGQSPSNPSNVRQQRRSSSRSLLPHRHMQHTRVQKHNRERRPTVHGLGQPSQNGAAFPQQVKLRQNGRKRRRLRKTVCEERPRAGHDR